MISGCFPVEKSEMIANAALVLGILSRLPSPITCAPNSSTKRTLADEDYYPSYDYDLPRNSINLDRIRNADAKYTVDVLPNVELPDDSLADTDLRDHDFIDNLMYVYYGSKGRNEGGYGPEVVIIGSVLSCAAQLLTIFFALLRKNLNGKREMRGLFLHMMGSLCVSNLIFMLGVYAVKSSSRCLLVALILHYLHLLTAFWMFLYCYYVYKRFSIGTIKNKYLVFIGYGLPLVFSLISYLAAPYSFETRRFCFMSVQKGMILNYMLPVSMLIVITTIYSLNGIRKINIELSKLELSSSAESLSAFRNELELLNDMKRQDYGGGVDDEVVALKESKTCLKLLCVIQTSYDIVWFIVVLALENNSDTNSMAIVYSLTSCLLNWYIFAKAKSFLPNVTTMCGTTEELVIRPEQEKSSNNGNNTVAPGSSDNIPLLINSENCTEMRELRLDYISTISN